MPRAANASREGSWQVPDRRSRQHTGRGMGRTRNDIVSKPLDARTRHRRQTVTLHGHGQARADEKDHNLVPQTLKPLDDREIQRQMAGRTRSWQFIGDKGKTHAAQPDLSGL